MYSAFLSAGAVMPMNQAESMWVNFGSRGWGDGYPCAVKIATGTICAITGETWVDHLNCDPQDYVVLPEQPWLDGYSVEKGIIRQFVAMPLGEGYSVEEQLTGKSEHGGLQIVVYPMKAERYEALRREREASKVLSDPEVQYSFAAADMGLAPGGRMKQDIYDDKYGLDAWDQHHSSRCFVTIANSATWAAITGERPPTKPPTAGQYTKAGLPWFDYYGGDAKPLDGAKIFKGLLSVAKLAMLKGKTPLPENESVDIPIVSTVGGSDTKVIREPDNRAL